MRKQGFEKGVGVYSKDKGDPIRRDRSVDNSGNPVEKPRQLDPKKLDDAAATGTGLPRNAR